MSFSTNILGALGKSTFKTFGKNYDTALAEFEMAVCSFDEKIFSDYLYAAFFGLLKDHLHNLIQSILTEDYKKYITSKKYSFLRILIPQIQLIFTSLEKTAFVQAVLSKSSIFLW